MSDIDDELRDIFIMIQFKELIAYHASRPPPGNPVSLAFFKEKLQKLAMNDIEEELMYIRAVWRMKFRISRLLTHAAKEDENKHYYESHAKTLNTNLIRWEKERIITWLGGDE